MATTAASNVPNQNTGEENSTWQGERGGERGANSNVVSSQHKASVAGEGRVEYEHYRCTSYEV